jgi:hypothetical protein
MAKRIAAVSAMSALLLCCACTAGRTTNIVSPGEVVARDGAGDIRTVSGLLRYGSHARQLWNDEPALRENDVSKCVTLVNTLPFEETLRRLDSTRVRIEGFAVPDVLSGRVDFGACNRVGFYIRAVRPLN